MNFINYALILQILILINPLSSFPVLVSAYENKMKVKKIALVAVLVAFILALIIVLIGPYLFEVFKITIDSFRIAGGIVLLLLGLDRIRSSQEKKKFTKADSIVSIIATPLLTGPAVISFLMVKTYEIGRMNILFDIFLAFVLVAIIFFIFSIALTRINIKVINISSKILGLFLTAIAIEMIAKGLNNLLLIKQVGVI
ncbi:MarC family protein [Candidatus Pacearchaeota archaeon]|nr:MarC family protein [Candidatus Pacearchaeota archaeon]